MRIEEELTDGGRCEMPAAGVREAVLVSHVHHPPIRVDDQAPFLRITHRHRGFCEQRVIGYRIRFVNFDAHGRTLRNPREPGPLGGLSPIA